ncbi:hypothetical protein K6119_11340 [Paracrocinitomix mangrovi]|uniref:hypothetical protein n=1 Tax=Paracrocinitomix mangrovi TaxID=2862509 RepID=UPI001C8E4DDC|nr:hypothetical protein [Paracrocinitomix mangrovi]UKN00328.1 hypothetical protein K6119_11340 [Paracrocinitomix mangrovi]
MKSLLLFIFLAPIFSLAQENNISCDDCWVEYKVEPQLEELPEDYCPLRICSDGSICCFLTEDNEIFKNTPGWTKIDENRLQIVGDEPKFFKIIKWTKNEIILESESNPKHKWYFKK